MKKVLPLLLLVLVFSGTPYRNHYNSTFGFIVCDSRPSCLHEIGHKLDHDSGWPSRGQDYRIALTAYMLRNWNYPQLRDPMSEKVLFYPGFFSPPYRDSNPLFQSFWDGGWGGTQELYADMFKWADGQRDRMPKFFIPFYNWDEAQTLTAKYTGE